MFLKKITLFNFRNFKNLELNFEKNTTFIVGKNSLGKTNILEAVYFLINGVGFREEKEEELIKIEENQSQVLGSFLVDNDFLTYEIKLKLVNGKILKKFYIENTEKNHFQYKKDLIKTVLFSPDQLNIIIGSPQDRRDYFNKIIGLFDYQYKKSLNNYEKALRKRNKLLEAKISIDKLKEELRFWDDYLIKQGSYLSLKRQEYIDFLNSHQKVDVKFFSIKYLKNEISKKSLEDSFEESLRYRKTLVGPQKDDFEILINEKNVHKFASRSEQRLAIFWLKINEIKYIEENLKTKPIVLLDDIFSELDDTNQKLIFPIIKNYQTIATAINKIEENDYQIIYL